MLGTAAHAGIDPRRHLAVLRQNLASGLLADDGLEPGHHLRKGMRPADRADNVVGAVHGGDPVAKGLVHGVLQGARAVRDRRHGGAQLFHPEHVGALPGHIFRAHVNRAFEAKARGHGGRRHAVLARPGLRDHPGLAHAPDQKPLLRPRWRAY